MGRVSRRQAGRKPPVVVVTGAAGFLGSATVIDLAADHSVAAVDRRAPSDPLRRATPGALWECSDVADAARLDACFRRARARHGCIDAVVHYAAFYHFGTDWHPEYDRTNLRGTQNVLEAATRHGARRLIFASSVAATLPPPPGQWLNERSPADGTIPYARSKAIGESMVEEHAPRLPAVVLRIGGVFSDWCELPPLYSLIRMWSRRGPAGRIVPGKGKTGVPYIHRTDLVAMVRACIARHEELDACEVLLACEHRAVLHEELFPVIRRWTHGGKSSRPLYVPRRVAKAGLVLAATVGRRVGIRIFEQPWMADYIDRPWLTDCRYSEQKLQVSPPTPQGALRRPSSAGFELLERLATMVGNRMRDPGLWELRNRRRLQGRYRYDGPSSDHASSDLSRRSGLGGRA